MSFINHGITLSRGAPFYFLMHHGVNLSFLSGWCVFHNTRGHNSKPIISFNNYTIFLLFQSEIPEEIDNSWPTVPLVAWLFFKLWKSILNIGSICFRIQESFRSSIGLTMVLSIRDPGSEETWSWLKFQMVPRLPYRLWNALPLKGFCVMSKTVWS